MLVLGTIVWTNLGSTRSGQPGIAITSLPRAGAPVSGDVIGTTLPSSTATTGTVPATVAATEATTKAAPSRAPTSPVPRTSPPPEPSEQGKVIYQATSLPGTGTCPNGGISWFNDPQQGRVIRTRIEEVSTGNSERCEFVGGGRGRLQNRMRVYVGWKSRVVMPVSGSWNGLFQLKCHGSHVADQPLVWSVRNSQLILENHEDIGGREVSRQVWSTAMPRDRWFSIVMKIHYSESRSDGYVQLWFNGTLQRLNNGETVHHGQMWDGSENNMHWGIYRRSSINGAQTHDIYRPRIATTFDVANPD
jgi:hypothetical protein